MISINKLPHIILFDVKSQEIKGFKLIDTNYFDMDD